MEISGKMVIGQQSVFGANGTIRAIDPAKNS